MQCAKWRVGLLWLAWDMRLLPEPLVACLIWREAKRMQRVHIAEVKHERKRRRSSIQSSYDQSMQTLLARPSRLIPVGHYINMVTPPRLMALEDGNYLWQGQKVLSHHYEANTHMVVLELESHQQVRVTPEYLHGL